MSIFDHIVLEPPSNIPLFLKIFLYGWTIFKIYWIYYIISAFMFSDYEACEILAPQLQELNLHSEHWKAKS